jgi:hypothetical protein
MATFNVLTHIIRECFVENNGGTFLIGDVLVSRMTVRISILETPCTHVARDSHFNYCQIMECVATSANGGMYNYLSKINYEI